jgi:hypothetical protein
MKNVIKFNSNDSKPVIFCILDRLNLCQDNFTKEITKNQADYTISNILSKGFNVYQGTDEYQLVLSSMLDGYKYAVIVSTGTEFVNGNLFFQKLKNLITTDFFICGHILDRGDAYYELHQQCYVINLKKFKELGMPSIGDYKLNSPHIETSPIRSLENYHDEYTPVSVQSGKDKKRYLHKCHGWYILKTAFEYNMKLVVFDEDFRLSKVHYYPESREDFLKQLNLIYLKDSYCVNEFVHVKNTERGELVSDQYDQIVIPASGTLYLDLIENGNVIVYDYNDKSLDYWREHLPRKPGIEYSFIKADLLSKNNLIDYIQPSKKTLINLSNIFAYEGTSALRPLYYRLYKENELIKNLQDKISDIDISFSARAATGFIKIPHVGNKLRIKPIPIENLKRPTWHDDSDWSTKPLQH